MKQYTPGEQQTLTIQQAQIEPLIDYLSKKPFIEVNQLLNNLLQNLQEVDSSDTKEQGST